MSECCEEPGTVELLTVPECAISEGAVGAMPDDEIQAMRRSPVWRVREAAAGTIARECRADESFLRRYQAPLAGLDCRSARSWSLPALVAQSHKPVNPKLMASIVPL